MGRMGEGGVGVVTGEWQAADEGMAPVGQVSRGRRIINSVDFVWC